ncbi:MAG: hypothetical protein WAJ85_14485 [Candidatus Baltobacteraceae bacterium]
MIVNLYVDHIMSPSPTSSEEVWNATREHSKVFAEAARQVGLTDAEYRDFRNALLDGKALYVRLPRRLDAMSGEHAGSVYAVKNAVMTTPVMGWKVSLRDGTEVYVPQVCGNISVLRHARIAHEQAHRFTPSVAQVPLPPETPVSLAPPQADVSITAPVASEAIVPAASHFSGLPFLIPAAVCGIFCWHSSTPPAPPAAPPCTLGSNSSGVCSN